MDKILFKAPMCRIRKMTTFATYSGCKALRHKESIHWGFKEQAASLMGVFRNVL